MAICLIVNLNQFDICAWIPHVNDLIQELKWNSTWHAVKVTQKECIINQVLLIISFAGAIHENSCYEEEL